MGSLLSNFGVGVRLLLAFLGISMFAVIGAVAALIAFAEVRSLVDELTRERVPASFAALELSRQAERIASAAGLFATDRTLTDQMRTDRELRTQLVELEELFAAVQKARPDSSSLVELQRAISLVRQNLAELQQFVAIHPTLDSRPSGLQPSNKPALIEKLLKENREAAAYLTTVVDRFVREERQGIAGGSAVVAATQRKSTVVLLGVVVLSLAGSALIVWLYVERNLVARLAALSASMLAIAGGNLKASLPLDGGRDEIARMAESLRVFRDTAAEAERVGRLKRFLAPQVAELIVSTGDEGVLDSHRRDVAVLFCDLRGFTAFSETAEPEEVVELLQDYHRCAGRLIDKFAGTLERFTGDGLLVLFNDPLPCPDPCLTAAHLAIEMRAGVRGVVRRWEQRGRHLGFGIGIAYGYATLGRIGFEGRFDYAAVGTVVNLAARLCERARADEILVDSKVHAAIDAHMKTEALGHFTPKGFSQSVAVFNISADSDPVTAGRDPQFF